MKPLRGETIRVEPSWIGLVPSWKRLEAPKSSFTLSSEVNSEKTDAIKQKVGSHRKSSSALILEFPASRTMTDKFPLFTSHQYMVFLLYRPEQTKTMVDVHILSSYSKTSTTHHSSSSSIPHEFSISSPCSSRRITWNVLSIITSYHFQDF